MITQFRETYLSLHFSMLCAPNFDDSRHGLEFFCSSSISMISDNHVSDPASLNYKFTILFTKMPRFLRPNLFQTIQAVQLQITEPCEVNCILSKSAGKLRKCWKLTLHKNEPFLKWYSNTYKSCMFPCGPKLFFYQKNFFFSTGFFAFFTNNDR